MVKYNAVEHSAEINSNNKKNKGKISENYAPYRVESAKMLSDFESKCYGHLGCITALHRRIEHRLLYTNPIYFAPYHVCLQLCWFK